MKRKLSTFCELLWQDILLFCINATPLLPFTAVLAIGLWRFSDARGSLILLVAVFPVIYIIFCLVLLLFLASLTRLLGLRKPAFATWRAGQAVPTAMVQAAIIYYLQNLIYSIPGVPTLQGFFVFKLLLFRSFCKHVRISASSSVYGEIRDPDMTVIGDYAVIGLSSRIVAHSNTTDSSGQSVYRSAPVVICSGAVIGGSSLVELGVSVGSDSIVEPMSRVCAFTVIPKGEVWGGNPAKYIRKREPAGESSATGRIAAKTSENVQLQPTREAMQAIDIVAAALGLSLEVVTKNSTANDFDEWDSLGQMAIASLLNTKLDVFVDAQEIFALKSVMDVELIIRKSSHNRTDNTHDIDHETSMQVSSFVAPIDFDIHSDPELIPLVGFSSFSKMTSSNTCNNVVKRGDLKICVASSYVANTLDYYLCRYCDFFGISTEVEHAGFNDIIHSLTDPSSLLCQNQKGINVLLIRFEDFASTTDRTAFFEGIDIYLKAIHYFATFGIPLLVSDLPPPLSVQQPNVDDWILDAQKYWRKSLDDLDGITVIPVSEIYLELGRHQIYDQELEEHASCPYRPFFFEHLASLLARSVRLRFYQAKKLIAVDADNTLWDGILGEGGETEIVVNPSHLSFQRQLLRLRDRGLLLALVSKNDPVDLLQFMNQSKDILLKPEHFVAMRIGWNPKSEYLREIAEELNISLDSFVFFDDSPLERLDVVSNCPGVTVVPLFGQCETLAQALANLWCFDNTHTSPEDATRSLLYQQERTRSEFRESTVDTGEFLRLLDLRLVVRRASAVDYGRVSQLSNRTNQFNLSLKRLQPRDVHELVCQGCDVWLLEASDRFGDYGLVGSCIVELSADQESAVLHSLFLSCRILSRGAEDAFVGWIASDLFSNGVSSIRAPYIRGPRNKPAHDFFARLGWGGDDNEYVGVRGVLPVIPNHLSLCCKDHQ